MPTLSVIDVSLGPRIKLYNTITNAMVRSVIQSHSPRLIVPTALLRKYGDAVQSPAGGSDVGGRDKADMEGNEDAAPGATGTFKGSGEDADFKFSSSEDEMDAAWRKLVQEEYPLLTRPQQLTNPWNPIPVGNKGKGWVCSQSSVLFVLKKPSPGRGRARRSASTQPSALRTGSVRRAVSNRPMDSYRSLEHSLNAKMDRGLRICLVSHSTTMGGLVSIPITGSHTTWPLPMTKGPEQCGVI